jgi:RNA polymerase sigma-70 factor (ECF subfamily)
VRDPKAYLFRTAGNLLIDHYRALAGRSTAAAEEPAQALADPRPSPEAVLLSREEIAVLRRAIDELPPRRREVFLLHKFEALSYAEIAQHLGIARNTVMVHMVRSLAHLKERLNAHRRNPPAGR